MRTSHIESAIRRLRHKLELANGNDPQDELDDDARLEIVAEIEDLERALAKAEDYWKDDL